MGSLCSKESSDYQNENLEQSNNQENNVYKSLSKQNLFSFYSGIFNFVELNLYDIDYPEFGNKKNTASLKKWFNQTNPDFRFSIRIPKSVLFFEKSKDNPISYRKSTDDEKSKWQKNENDYGFSDQNYFASFLEELYPIKEKILNLIVTVPKNMTIKNGRQDLEKILNICKNYGYHISTEFHHPSWFQDLSYNLLKKYNSSLLWSDKNKKNGFSIITSNFIYLCINDKSKIYWWAEHLQKRIFQEILDKKNIKDLNDGKEKNNILDFIVIIVPDYNTAEKLCKILGIGIQTNELKIKPAYSNQIKKRTFYLDNKQNNFKSNKATSYSSSTSINDDLSVWKENRIIMHVDLNSFYPSCEELRDHTLKGRPHAVIMTGQKEGEKITRGVVASCSYEAKQLGVKSAMPLSFALQLCPDLILKKSDISYYRKISQKVMQILEKYSDVLEQASIDEAYLDCTEKIKEFSFISKASDYGNLIKKTIFGELGLLCSIGIAPNKSIAKIASDFKKPDGLTVVTPDKTKEFLFGLEVERISGVGVKTQNLLSELNIKSIGQLATMDVQVLVEKCGSKTGTWLWMVANGRDDKEVIPRQDHVSLSTEHSLKRFTNEKDVLKNLLDTLAEDLYKRIQIEKYEFKTVGIKLVKIDFTSKTREISFPKYQNSKDSILQVIPELLNRFALLSENMEGSINKVTNVSNQKNNMVIGVDNSTVGQLKEKNNLNVYNDELEYGLVRKIGLRVSNLKRIGVFKESRQKRIEDFFKDNTF